MVTFARRLYRIVKFVGAYCALLLLVLLIFVAMLTKFFVLYCILPAFIFFSVFTIAMRERDRNFRVREIMRDVFSWTIRQ